MQRIELDRGGVIVSCLVGGDGPPFVLLHGLAGAAEELRPTAGVLIAAGHRVVVPDQRGHGHSTRRPEDLSRRAYAADAAAVIEHCAPGTVVTLAGQSMGGHTAMLVAAWYPHLVGRLIMLEAGVGGTEPGDDYPARLGRWLTSWPLPFEDRAAAVTFLGGTPTAVAWAADLERHEDGLRPRFDADVMQAAIEPVAAQARWDEWRSITAPTLLIRGANGTCPAAEDERMRALRPDVGYAVIPDAGHDAHLDQPSAWLDLLRAAPTRPRSA